MAMSVKENGEMIYRKDKPHSNGQMDIVMRATGRLVNVMDKVSSILTMAASNTKANGRMISKKEKASSTGHLVTLTKVDLLPVSHTPLEIRKAL